MNRRQFMKDAACGALGWAGLSLTGSHPPATANPGQARRPNILVGFTGKGWGPGDRKRGGWTQNPAGPEYSTQKLATVLWNGIDRADYAGNFEAFLAQRPEGAPFCFWYGGHEPHRTYEKGSGLKSGKNLADVSVPAFLPDDAAVRGDMLDCFLEVEWFDSQLGRMLQKSRWP